MNEVEKLYPKIVDNFLLHYYGDKGLLYYTSRGNPISKELDMFLFDVLAKCDGLSSIYEIYLEILNRYQVDDDIESFMGFINHAHKDGLLRFLEEPAALEGECKLVSGVQGLNYPYMVNVELTNACNLHCKHCYKNAGASEEIYFNTDDFFVLLEKFRGKIAELHITGGEPMLHPEFYEMVQKGSKWHRILLATNGTMNDKSNAQILSECVDTIQITVYGYNEASYFENTGSSDGFIKLVEGLRALIDVGKNPVVSVIADKTNLGDLGRYIETLHDVGVRKVRMGLVAGMGRALQNMERYEMSKDELNYLVITLDEIVDKFRTMDIFYSKPDIFDYYSPAASIVTDSFSSCGAGKTVIAVGEDGMVRPCQMLPSEYFSQIHFNEYIDALESKTILSNSEAIEAYVKMLKRENIPLEFIQCLNA